MGPFPCWLKSDNFVGSIRKCQADFFDYLNSRNECLICFKCFRITLNVLYSRSENARCPIDNEPLSREQSFRDKCCEREVLGVQCFCRFNDKGCEWKGELRQLEVLSVPNCLSNECLNIDLPAFDIFFLWLAWGLESTDFRWWYQSFILVR